MIQFTSPHVYSFHHMLVSVRGHILCPNLHGTQYVLSSTLFYSASILPSHISFILSSPFLQLQSASRRRRVIPRPCLYLFVLFYALLLLSRSQLQLDRQFPRSQYISVKQRQDISTLEFNLASGFYSPDKLFLHLYEALEVSLDYCQSCPNSFILPCGSLYLIFLFPCAHCHITNLYVSAYII